MMPERLDPRLRPPQSNDLATIEIGLGKRDAALAWMEKEYQQHDDDGPWGAKVDPIFEPLRSERY